MDITTVVNFLLYLLFGFTVCHYTLNQFFGNTVWVVAVSAFFGAFVAFFGAWGVGF